MSILLGSLVFDPDTTIATERHEETGGQDARVVEIRGVVDGLGSAGVVQAALDAVLAAASAEESVALSLRTGRRLWVLRKSFERMLSADGLSGSFVLTLEAENPFEESETETVVSWVVGQSGASQMLNTGGSADSMVRVSMVASGTVVDPGFSDGLRTIRYAGLVGNGQTLLVDGLAATVRLDGVDVTPYTSGAFPRVSSGGTELSYTDDASSSHHATVTVSYRERWW